MRKKYSTNSVIEYFFLVLLNRSNKARFAVDFAIEHVLFLKFFITGQKKQLSKVEHVLLSRSIGDII